MASIQNISIEQLAQAFKELSEREKLSLFDLLPEEWFGTKEHILTEVQKKALDAATTKEIEGRAIFSTWEDVEKFVKTKKRG